MSENSEQVKQSDVTLWGVAALVAGAFAILAANLGALMPANMMAGLHATRAQGGSLNQLRAEVAGLRDTATRMRAENRRIETMLAQAEQESGMMVRRLGSIEATLPGLRDSGSSDADIDAALTTASIEDGTGKTMQTEGGSVMVTQQPMAKTAPKPVVVQERPQQIAGTPEELKPQPVQQATGPATAFGLALGPNVRPSESVAAWEDISRKAGPLLLGLGPILAGTAGAEHMQLVAGPISAYAEAEQICDRMIRIGVLCLPVPYMGNALPQ